MIASREDKMRMKYILIILMAGVFAISARGAQINISASQDATLLGGADAVNNASLADPGIFAGTDGQGNPKRGLIEFNVAGALPAGAVVTSAQLQLTLGQTAGTGGVLRTISLFDETQAWGQPANIAGASSFANAGHGASPGSGDATWNYAFYNTTAWNAAGGNWSVSSADIADASVGTTITSYTWSSAAMAADVQNWLNNPASSFGWLLKNSNETTSADFRAFWSAQGAAADNNPALAPVLIVNFNLPEPVGIPLISAGLLLFARRRK